MRHAEARSIRKLLTHYILRGNYKDLVISFIYLNQYIIDRNNQ
jgi:hypothetical protein